ncbi:MAG: DUF1566 domain-containing protein [Treponema sp.]|nr:DUF1566 domain-containing protein [Treponema sp.]
MKRFILLAALLALLSIGLFAQETALPRLAVVEFNTNISNEKTKADAITVRNLVESQMVGTRKYQIITRDDIDKLLENQKIQVRSISSSENLKKLQLQNISYIVTGSLDAMGNDYAVTVRVLDVSTGQFSHSDNDFMGSGSRELFNGINSLMAKFAAGMSADEKGAIVQGQARRTPAATGISIEVSTKEGGTLYFQNEEIATLWDNDKHSIPIEKPGTYTVKMVFANGSELSNTVTITQRGITKMEFKYYMGAIGPGGGYVFYDKGNNNDGWRYLEAAPANTEFSAAWDNAVSRCRQLNINGITGWYLPDKDQLNLMYKNLKAKGLGGFSGNDYWSSSQLDYSYAWYQEFGSGGRQYNTYKNRNYHVRAVRAF